MLLNHNHGIDSGHVAPIPEAAKPPAVYMTTKVGATFRTRLLDQLGRRMVRAGQVLVEAESVYADTVLQRDKFVNGTKPWKDIDNVASRILKRKRDIETSIKVTGPNLRAALLGNVEEDKAPLYRALIRETLKAAPKVDHRAMSDAIKPAIEAGPGDEFETIKARLFAALGIAPAPEQTA